MRMPTVLSHTSIEYRQSILHMMEHKIIGIRGDADPERIISHFIGLGGEVVLFDPDRILGRDHVESALMHAERAMAHGTNRSKTLLTEIILYAAWERQVGRAVDAMRPKEGRDEYVALVLNVDDPRLEDLGMTRDDTIIDATKEKADALGLRDCFLSYEDQAVENVAIVDLLKA